MAGARRCSRRAPSTYQPACKPGSVGRRANPPRDGHSSGTPLARRLQQPTRTTGPRHKSRVASRRPYSVLLPVGFAVPLPSPEARCALTAPFHPCRHPCGLGGLLSVALSLGFGADLRRRFLPPDVIRHRMSMEPGLSSQCCLSAMHQAAVRPTDAIDVGFLRSELNDVRATSLTDGAMSPRSKDRRAHPPARAGNGAGTRSRPGASHRRRGAKPRGRTRT